MRFASIIVLLLCQVINACCAVQGSVAELVPKQAVGDGVPLRVLLIGDSIVVGYASTDFNGFRQHLLDAFVESGSPSVEFIGTQQLGPDPKMANHFEGYPAHRVRMLHDKIVASNILVQKPNIIMIIAGTNDLNQPDIVFDPRFSSDFPRELALYRLQIMLEYITCASPESVILVGSLPPIANATAQALAVDFNAKLPDIIAPGHAEGTKIHLVEFGDMSEDLMAWDGIHPNDQGYVEVAKRWFQAVKDLPSGYIPAPSQPDIPAGNATAEICQGQIRNATTCPKCQGIWHCWWSEPDVRCGSY